MYNILGEILNISPDDMLNIYLIGSRLFGYNQEDSDSNLIITVPEEPVNCIRTGYYQGGIFQATLYSVWAFQKRLSGIMS